MAAPSDSTSVVDAQKRAPAEYKKVIEFLRGKQGPKIRRGILNGKRVDYFKGKTAIRTLLGPGYAKLKKVPELKDEAEAEALLTKVLPHAFFLRVDRATNPPSVSGQPKPLLLSPTQSFEQLSYYAWFYDGSPLTTYLGSAAMLIVMLTGVMFPLWPAKLRLGVWYLSLLALGALGALLVLAVIRLIIWCATVVSMKKAIWIFPNLFEDVGFFESFVPTWAYDEPKKKKKKVKSATASESRKSKGAKAEPASAAGESAEGEGEAEAEAEAASTGVEVDAGPSAATTTKRHAFIEEVEDEE